MARSQDTFNKREKEKKRLKKQKEKQQKKEERKANSPGGGLENMMAYVDEFGNIVDTPPDPTKKKEEIKAESIELGIPKKEKVDADPVRKGRVEFFNHSKGFGFIKDAENHEKYFVHINGVLDDEIDENDQVQFELERGMKGMNAVRVQKIQPGSTTEEAPEEKEDTSEEKEDASEEKEDTSEDKEDSSPQE